jgi:hypothetical protein
LIINSLIAAGLSAMILFKDKDTNEGDKTNIFLTLGLVFWFIANILKYKNNRKPSQTLLQYYYY